MSTCTGHASGRSSHLESPTAGVSRYVSVYTGMYRLYHVIVQVATRNQSQLKMLHEMQNERFTFEIESETALVDSTLERSRLFVFNTPISDDINSI